MKFLFVAVFVVWGHCLAFPSVAAAASSLELKAGDRVVFIGNTFAERLGAHGYFEAQLAARFPELKLTFRNLGFSGDEAVRGTLGSGAGPGTIGKLEDNTWLQLRALNFRDIFSHLEEQKADVIFACYGMNESFAGAAGLPRFERDLAVFLNRLTSLKCGNGGKAAPRLVLVGPIPHEDLGGDLPDPAAHNENLKAGSAAMRRVAEGMNVPFIDLFTSLQPIMADKSGSPLTFNGIHLTRYGNWVAAQFMMVQLGFATPAATFEVKAGDPSLALAALPPPPAPPGAKVHAALLNRLPLIQVRGLGPGTYTLRVNGRDIAQASAADWSRGVRALPAGEAAEALVAAVDDKNWEFFMKYRAVNGEYIYGRRKEPFGVVNFPKEFEFQEKLVAEKDGKMQSLARPPGTLQVELVKADR